MTKEDDELMLRLLLIVRASRRHLLQKRKEFPEVIFGEDLLNNYDKFLSYKELIIRGNLEEKTLNDLWEILDRIREQSDLASRMIKQQEAIKAYKNIQRPNQ